MNMIKTIVASVAIMAATTLTAQARDSVSIGFNIGGHGNGYISHSIGTHRHAPAFYGYYGTPRHYSPRVYYSARPVIYYEPSVRYKHHRHSAHDGKQGSRKASRHGNDWRYGRGDHDNRRGRR